MKKKSEFGKIHSVDLLNAVYHGIVTVSIPLINIFFNQQSNSLSDYKILIGCFLSAFIGSIFKTGVTNSDGKIFKKEN